MREPRVGEPVQFLTDTCRIEAAVIVAVRDDGYADLLLHRGGHANHMRHDPEGLPNTWRYPEEQ